MKRDLIFLISLALLIGIIVLLFVISNLRINGYVTYDNLAVKKNIGMTGNSIVDLLDKLFRGNGEVLLQAPTINVVINASRTSCVAPCAIFFEGTDSLDASGNSINSIGLVNSQITEYDWDFGQGTENDVSSGGRYFKGFNAAHVYETNGTYLANLTIKDAQGNSDTKQMQINVQPFTGITICRSSSGNFAGCPTGATHETTIAYSGAGANTKVLYRRGETFTFLDHVSYDGFNTIIGAFPETGTLQSRPIIQYTGTARYSGSGEKIFFNSGRVGNDVSFKDVYFHLALRINSIIF